MRSTWRCRICGHGGNDSIHGNDGDDSINGDDDTTGGGDLADLLNMDRAKQAS